MSNTTTRTFGGQFLSRVHINLSFCTDNHLILVGRDTAPLRLIYADFARGVVVLGEAGRKLNPGGPFSGLTQYYPASVQVYALADEPGTWFVPIVEWDGSATSAMRQQMVTRTHEERMRVERQTAAPVAHEDY